MTSRFPISSGTEKAFTPYDKEKVEARILMIRMWGESEAKKMRPDLFGEYVEPGNVRDFSEPEKEELEEVKDEDLPF